MEPIRILRLEGLGFLLSLSGLIVYRMLTRQINLSGLLTDSSRDGQVTGERVQLLVMTIAVSAKVLGTALHGTGNAMPEVGWGTLSVFGASSGVYVAVKGLKMLRAGRQGLRTKRK